MRQMTWLMVVTVILVSAAGCTGSGPDQAVVATPAASAAAVAKVGEPATAAVHPCAMLANASVTLAVPGAQAGLPADEDAAVGISGCRWPVGAGVVTLQVFDAGPGSVENELRAASLEVVELKRPDAASLVRIESLTGIGDKAGAYVERIDSKRGIRKSGAALMVQNGNRRAILRIPQLADGDRALALASMKKLGTEIASAL